MFAGPAILPLEVMEQAQKELLALPSIGLSVMEISHRDKAFDAIIKSAEAGVKKILGVPDNYTVLFLQGGASLQFGMIPMNFLQGGVADFVHTGEWASKAIKEAKLFGTANVVASSEDKGFNYVPALSSIKLTKDAKYVHITTNETIGGIQFQEIPETGSVPLIADMSSDFVSRPIDVSKYGIIYAGAQKNIGPSGVCLVIIRNDLIAAGDPKLTTMLKYSTHAKEPSLYNTPNTWGIYLIDLVMKWLERNGGITAMEKTNEKKAGLIYSAIDGSNGYYRGTAEKTSRSKMNICFRLATEALEEKFVKDAKVAGFLGLKGHRSVGGCRASIYNAFPLEGCERFVEFMAGFAKGNPA
jgi:phosphoserine aminotransferase